MVCGKLELIHGGGEAMDGLELLGMAKRDGEEGEGLREVLTMPLGSFLR